MTNKTVKKTFSIPPFIANRLDELSLNTGVSQSNLVYQALAAYLHRFEQDESLESWLEMGGKGQGGVELIY